MKQSDVSFLFKNLVDLPIKVTQTHFDRYDARVELVTPDDKVIGFLFKGVKASSAEEAKNQGSDFKDLLTERGQRVWRIFSLLAPENFVVCAVDDTLAMMNDMDSKNMSREEFWQTIERLNTIYFFSTTISANVGVWQQETPILRIGAKYYKNRPEASTLEQVIPFNIAVHLF